MISEKALALGAFKAGESGHVVGYNPSGVHAQYRQKLLALGLIPGTRFCVTRKAPLGCPIEISFRGCALSLRKEEIDILQVERPSGE